MTATDVFAPGSNALITGAASGIGLAIAKLCRAKGMRVCLVDRETDALQKAKGELPSAQDSSDRDVLTLVADVSKPASWEALKEDVIKAFGSVELLVLNAGMAAKGGWEDADSFRNTFETNFFGVVYGINTFLPLVQSAAKSKATAIIITGSKQGITNPPGNPAYNASKSAVKCVAEHLSWDLRNDKTSVHLLVPGWTFTGLTGGGQGKAKPSGAWTPEQVADYLYRKMGEEKFYVICPDNDVSEETDKRRMLWTVGDIVEERPPLTRWREEWKQKAEESMAKMRVAKNHSSLELHTRKRFKEAYSPIAAALASLRPKMSEDDIEMLGPDSSRVDRDRRAPRFSWTPAYETTFFRSLCDSVQLGLRENSSFKAEAWDRAIQALQASHGAYPAKSHLINKSDNARKRFRLWRGLREDPEFVYSAVTRTVTASDEAWTAHIEREPLSRALRGRPFSHEEYMEILYPDVIGSGGAPKRIIRPRRRDGVLVDELEMPGAGVLNLQLESSPCQVSESLDKRLYQPPTGALPVWNVSNQPDESAANGQARKRGFPSDGAEASLDDSPPNSSVLSGNAPNGSPAKRMRTAVSADTLSAESGAVAAAAAAAAAAVIPSATTTSGGSVSSIPAPSPSNTTPLSMPTVPMHGHGAAVWEESDTAKGRPGLRWQEMALDLFFREFADQDLDLQIKISESVLRDEHRALVFCKMPWRVRQHWIGKFTEAHHRGS
ncbi:hypothetical protein CP533_3731 [Ophiocordyceps camponoti-saundersi (nom. inval.)]|nr:hypothetical protein CP533_3731 [Ophiocordyceps camponoti-saundersi (nom. inval.)]